MPQADRGFSEWSLVSEHDRTAAGELVETADADGLPPGNHPLEVAARRGLGPLSEKGREIWHGHTRPCVSCGQLVLRHAPACDYCAQDLTDEMIEKMRAVAGPWYVLEHVRPFPGVNIDRIIRQIHRGVLTETSIIRGPATDYQWKYAVETPGLCRYFNKCWNCFEVVQTVDTHCPACLSNLTFERSRPHATGPPPSTKDRFDSQPPAPLATPPRIRAPALEELSAALGTSDARPRRADRRTEPRVGPVSVRWIVAAMLLAAILVLIWLTRIRSQEPVNSSGLHTPAARSVDST